MFDFYINDTEERWERKKEDGTEIGNEKIYAIKYADDVAVTSQTLFTFFFNHH